MSQKNYFYLILFLFFILFSSQKSHADYKLGVFLEEMCFENGYGFAFTKQRSSIACKPYGVVINKFANPSLAKDIGVKQMDVIVNFDGKDTKTMRAFVNQFSSTKHKINHEMIIHRWNNSLGKMEQFKVNFKVPGKSENIEKKTVKNNEDNKSSKLKNQKIEEELFVSIDNLVIRNKPNGKKIGNLYKNNKVVVYDKNNDKSWTLVQDTNTNLMGWVSSKYLSKNKITKDNKDQNLETAKIDNKKEDKNVKTETKKEKTKEKLYIGSHLATINLNTKIIRFNDSETFTPKNKDKISYTYKELGDNKKQIIINGEGIFKFKNGEVYEGQIKDSKIDGVGRYKFGKFNEYTYTGNFVNGQKSGNGKLEFNANVYNKWSENEYNNLRKEKYKELKIAKKKRKNLLSGIDKLEIKKESLQVNIKKNLRKCENINRKIADDFDFDVSSWDSHNCNQFKLLKCERLCYHKTDSFDSCNNCHKQVGILPEEDASIDSQIETYKSDLVKNDNLINELQNSYENITLIKKVSFSIKSSWDNDEMDISNPVKLTFHESNNSYNGFINNEYEPNGIGELVLGKIVIKGEWANGFIDKQANIKFPNNNTVIGPLNFYYSEKLTRENFNADKLNITNQDYKINFSNGDTYSGTIKIKSENLNTPKYPFLLHGFGKIIYKSGDQYEGEWINDLKSGLGEYQSKDGDLYNGQWKEDKKHNQGTMIYKNGEKYEGEWKENKRDGSGILFNSENIIIQKGLYKDDDFLEGYNDNKYLYANGNIYDGELDDYFPYGYGIVLNKEGKLISKGKFQKNKKTGLFIEFLANQYKLIDYDYVNGKEKEILTNIEILEICRTESKKNDDCYGKKNINFLNEKNLNGTFIGVFKDNHPSNGIIKFGKNEKRLDYFSGNILEDKHGYKYDGQLFYIDDNYYFEGVYAILFPEKNKNYQFLGTRYNRDNGNERKWKLIDEISIKEEFINNYSILTNGKIKFKKDILAFKHKEKKCLNRFHEINYFKKDFKKITDFKDVKELRKKVYYYQNLYKKLDEHTEKDKTYKWDASLRISGIIDCYEKPYNQIIDYDNKKKLDAGIYDINLITSNYIVIENNFVIKRFNDELTSLEEYFRNYDKDFKKNLEKKSFENYNHILLDYAFSEFPNEIINYKNNLIKINEINITLNELKNELSSIENDKIMEKNQRKEKIKFYKSEIKKYKKEIKNLNKDLDKNYQWNNFETITKMLKSKVGNLSLFLYEEMNSDLKNHNYHNIFTMIDEWEVQLTNYNLEQEEAKRQKARRDESNIQRCREINTRIAYRFSFTEAEGQEWIKYNCSSYGFIQCRPLCALRSPYCADTGCSDTWHYRN